MDKQSLTLVLVVLGAFVLTQLDTHSKQSDHQKALAAHARKRAAYAAWQKAQGIAAPGSATASGVGSASRTSGHPDGGAPPANDRRARFLAGLRHEDGIPFEAPGERAFSARHSTRGAAVEALTFTTIKESTFKLIDGGGARELKLFQPLRAYDARVRTLALVSPAAEKDLDALDWAHEALADGAHRFTRVLPDGDVTITKELRPVHGKDAYHFELVVGLENAGEVERRVGYTLYGPAGMLEQNFARSAGVEAVLATRDQHDVVDPKVTVAAQIAERKTPLQQVEASAGTRIAYFGLRTKYFAAMIVPRGERRSIETVQALPLLQAAGRMTPTSEDLRGEEDAPVKQAVVQGIVPPVVLTPGAKVEHSYMVFVGPRSDELLETEAYKKAGLDHLIEWGWFESLTRLLTWIVKGFHGLTGNWGVAIILLTLVVRTLMHPVLFWQSKNMSRMQKLQPEMAKLKVTFEGKDGTMTPQAQQEYQRATLALYKKHQINPIGCMGPLFLQMPVFIALYGAVNNVYELRQQSFALWIRDLSEPDVVLRLPWAIFVGHGTNALSILPILMIITYVVQARMQPLATDPKAAEQQKMMQWMMPVMGYMFWTMPSGLLLYFVTSSGLGMLEQRWIKKRLARLDAQWTGQPA